MQNKKIKDFQLLVWNYYRNNRREFAWRNIDNPYYVMVSEVMLQQTQTHRVVEKYEMFLVTFPTLQSLASATLQDVLSVWQGLGYYRRARYLHQTAIILMNEYNGIIPSDPILLQKLPGIGTATASSICAFAFNAPTIFIETNIRTVFIYSFFQNGTMVHDRDILPLIEQSVDHDNPREWYYALMDYGVFLKLRYSNFSRKSAHYNKQTKFEGSDRQIRASILKLIVEQKTVQKDLIFELIDKDKSRVEKSLQSLEKECFIVANVDNTYTIG